MNPSPPPFRPHCSLMILLGLTCATGAYASPLTDCRVAPDSSNHIVVTLKAINTKWLRPFDPVSLRPEGHPINVRESGKQLTSMTGVRDNHGLICIEFGGERLWVRSSAVTVACKPVAGTVADKNIGPGLLGIGLECAK